MTNWLTLEEAAEHLKMGRSTLYKLAQKGKMPGHKIGRAWRFDVAELDQWLKSGEAALNREPPKAQKRRKQEMKPPSLRKIEAVLQERRDELFRDYGVIQIGVFGSCVRGQATDDSDIDILVEFNRPVGFFKFLELEERLSQWLGAKVDLVTKAALKPRIGRRILDEVAMLLIRDYRDYLEDIRDAIAETDEFTSGMSFESFVQDRKTINAVVRSLEVLGEAAKRIPDNLRAQTPDVPWKRMAGMRDKLIHEYFGVDLSTVWAVIKDELPPLRPAIERLLKKLEKEG